ncbi:MAG: hypothetical protein AAFX78_11445 [Cyanobacteria bacterium J06638_20]
MSAVPQPMLSPQQAGYGSRGELLRPIDRPRSMNLVTPAAQRSALPVRQPTGHLRPVATPPRSTPIHPTPTRSAPNVRRLPTAKPVPGWLRAMAIAQGIALPLTFAMVGIMGIVYGWSVYAQQRWSQNYDQLDQLRQREQQLLAADEAFKNELAQQAMHENSALVVSDLNSTLFMDAPPPVGPRPDTPTEAIAPALQPPSRPLAY